MVSVGEIFDAKVLSVMPFGAFVGIGDNVSGLVHISEISNTFVKDINDHIKKGDQVKVMVIKIDDDGKISFSIKQAMPEKKVKKQPEEKQKKQPVRPAEIDWAQNNDELSFEDKLSKFKSDSEEAFRTLKRNAASKRSGGYSRKGNYSF